MRRTLAALMMYASVYAFFVPLLPAQHAVDPSMRYYRVIGLVHLIGSGKADDPIRPEYAPMAFDKTRQGILAWSFQITDDKQMAIIHLVAANHHAFDAILTDKRPEVKVFEIGQHRLE